MIGYALMYRPAVLVVSVRSSSIAPFAWSRMHDQLHPGQHAGTAGAGGEDPEDDAGQERAAPAMKAAFMPLDRSGEVFDWDSAPSVPASSASFSSRAFARWRRTRKRAQPSSR